MLKSLSFNNYKAFKEMPELLLKPITLLCGTNSCGKSSIIQSILLMKQTMESQNPNQTLLLNGRFVHMGIFKNIVYDKSAKNELSIKMTFDFNDSIGTNASKLPISFFVGDVFPSYKVKEKEKIKNLFGVLRFVLKSTTRNQNDITSGSFIIPMTVKKWEFSSEIVFESGRREQGSSISIKQENVDKYKVQWKKLEGILKKIPRNSSKSILMENIKFINLIPSIINSEEKDNSTFEINHFLSSLRIILGKMLSDINYIGPLREEPLRRYIYEDEVVEIGIKGENAAYIYLSEKDRQIENQFFYNTVNDKFELIPEIKLSDAITKWLNLMNIKNFKPELKNEIISLSLDARDISKTRVNIADVGFGVSQIFPIVLEGLRMPKNHTLLLEQPEIHLHPKLQMQMADYFISLAKSNKNIIVETHSDHVINRLVRRIIEDDSGELNNLVGIYFIKQTEAGSVVEEIKIDDKFGIVNWPDGFFDQAGIEQEKILRAGLNKRRTLRNKEGN